MVHHSSVGTYVLGNNAIKKIISILILLQLCGYSFHDNSTGKKIDYCVGSQIT